MYASRICSSVEGAKKGSREAEVGMPRVSLDKLSLSEMVGIRVGFKIKRAGVRLVFVSADEDTTGEIVPKNCSIDDKVVETSCSIFCR
jgi:hypothetical protein